MIHLLTGEVHGGKTTWVKEATLCWKARGFPLAGFYSEAIIKDGDHFGYDLIDLKGGGRFPYVRTQGEPGWPRAGRFYLRPETLARAQDLIRAQKPPELLIVDEIGPMEIRCEGLWPALEKALFPALPESKPVAPPESPSKCPRKSPQQSPPEYPPESPPECLIVLRKRIAEDFAVMLGDADVKVYDIRNPDTPAQVTGRFEHYLKRAK